MERAMKLSVRKCFHDDDNDDDLRKFKLKVELIFIQLSSVTLDFCALREEINTEKNESSKYCLRKSHAGEEFMMGMLHASALTGHRNYGNVMQ